MPEAHDIDHRAIADAVAAMAPTTVLGDGAVDLATGAELLEMVAVSSTVYGAARLAVETSVGAARRGGCTWTEIGDALGVTRQAAFQRYGRPPA